MTRIAAQLIVRNEGKHLMQCLNSIAPYVDAIFIGLAGESTDDTEQVIRDFIEEHSSVPVLTINIPWNDNFSEARNVVLDEIRKNGSFTHTLWIDGDDELVGGHLIAPALAEYPDSAALTARYEYWRDEFGNVNTTLIRNRVLNLKNNWRWQNTIHEVITHSDPGMHVMMEKMFIRHLGQEKERDTGRNFRLLQKAVIERGERSPVMVAYLAAEYAVRDQHETAIPLWNEAIQTAKNNDERYVWLIKLAASLRVLQSHEDATQVLFTAMQLNPDWPDAYYGLAELAFDQKDWKSVIIWTEHGRRFAMPQTTLPINPLDYTANPLMPLAIAQANMGDVKQALESVKQAYKLVQSPMLKALVDQFQDTVSQERVFRAFMTVQEALRRNDEWLKAREIFKYAPKMLESQPDVRQAHWEVMESTRHVDDPSVLADYYINNPGWEPIPEEILDGTEWPKHPRVKYAIDTARKIGAGNILDIGCSDGFISIPVALSNSEIKVDGLDLDPRCTKLATERAAARGLSERVQFHEGPFETLDEWSSCERYSKYDLAIFFEAIEHVVNPAATLDVLDRAASHVVLTTPHLAWEGDNQPNWNKVELKGHLRIFDLEDIELLLQHRGRIYNLYVQQWDERHSWIFADYDVGEETDKQIQIICPPAIEAWGPTKLRQEGLGGSETAVIRLAEELSELGHMVTVHNNLDAPGYFNKVRYRSIEAYAPTVKTDLSIAWRAPELADARPRTGCFVLWMHDTDAGDRLTPERAEQFDRIVVLSNWHRDYFLHKYPFISADKLVIIGNGVDLDRFDWLEKTDHERNPKKVVYSSSPDRGLELILEHIWPSVIKAVPDAELHYYYGWNNFFLASFPHLRQFKAKVMELQSQTQGVVEHGRVNQDELARELMSAGVWLYPTYFPETYCITAVEAQLAGLLPVTNRFAALKETVKNGVFLNGRVNDPMVLKLYADAVIEALTNPISDEDRIAISRGAPANSWSQVARTWWEEFLS